MSTKSVQEIMNIRFDPLTGAAVGQDSLGVQSIATAPANIAASMIIEDDDITVGMGITNDDSIGDATDLTEWRQFQITDGAQEIRIVTDATDLLFGLDIDDSPIVFGVVSPFTLQFDLTAENANLTDGSKFWLSGGAAANYIYVTATRRAV